MAYAALQPQVMPVLARNSRTLENTILSFPDSEKSLKQRISSYKSFLNKEKREHGFINDGAGKRYTMFPLHLLLGDSKKSELYIKWYESEFPDDSREPIQLLCWSIILKRSDKDKEAKYKTVELMLSNLYLIPKLIGKKISKYNMWHSSNCEEIEYLDYLPQQVIDSITKDELMWLEDQYNSFEFKRIRKRYIEIFSELQLTKDVESRTELLDEAYRLPALLK